MSAHVRSSMNEYVYYVYFGCFVIYALLQIAYLNYDINKRLKSMPQTLIKTVLLLLYLHFDKFCVLTTAESRAKI